MTEDEAKGKWCPFGNIQGFGNRDSDGSAFHKGGAYPTCIGSACMAWRWAGYRAENGTWVRKAAGEPWSGSNGDGFCGLAGSQ